MKRRTTHPAALRGGLPLLVLASLGVACYGGRGYDVGPDGQADSGGTESSGDADDGSGDSAGDDGMDPEPVDPEAPDCTEVGPRMVRRLTSVQLHRSLETIFNDTNVPEAQVLDDPVVHGFRVDATESVIRELGAQQVMQYAETVAAWAVPAKLGELTPCSSNDAGCRDQIVRELGAKFHRQPLDDNMVAAYSELMAQESDFEDGVRELISALIQSPYFLYRRELGQSSADDPSRFALTDYELASNLSYSLTDGPPDAELLQKAAAGQLSSEAELLAQAERLVQTQAGQDRLAAFTRSWLEVDDLQSRVKAEEPGVMFDEELRGLMLGETESLFLHVFNSDGGVAELLQADYTFVNQRLGHFYRLWQANTPEPMQMTIPAEGEGARARGLLGHGSVLARHSSADNSSPVARGVMVRRRLLCQELPDPPSDVDTNLQPIPEGATNRERYEQHATDPACAGCHTLIDPVGYAFEHYDQLGRWRDQESNQPVDATGMLTGVESIGDVPLDDVDSLSDALAGSTEVRACFAGYLAYYTYGLDGCSAADIEAVAGSSDATLRSTLEAIVTAPHFRERVEQE